MTTPASGAHPSKASLAVIEALEKYYEMEIEALDFTLYDFCDPDALNSLFIHNGSDSLHIKIIIDGTSVIIWQSCEINAEIHTEE
ncbi:HalOD1 output domain-containing protein [Haladaptatus sp. CMAA 1911]|uniref:HalOD1 output domain-containing protein n=1 Tax=unclassified Haladaptatus TaxID=2622732 RepID=UPI00375525B2